MDRELSAAEYRRKLRKLLDTVGVDNLNKIYPEAPSWIFPLQAADGVSISDAISRFDEVDHLIRSVLSLYNWPQPVVEDGYIIEPRGFYIEHDEESLEAASPNWIPQPGQKIRNFYGFESNQILDLREWGLNALQALAVVKEAIKVGNAPAAAMAAGTALGFAHMIEQMLQISDMVRGSRRQARVGRSRRKINPFKEMPLEIPVFTIPDKPPEGHATLISAAREVAKSTGEDPRSIVRRWNRKGIRSPRPIRTPRR
ncbi:MAG TPA: hypothetical protein VHL31_11600 [Geminicoccus sp.]|jgi:hypothetical protein|uniref:hypothetical protein n=1 Tax=Geminicoccus sp. TaxID=2024832 RepID=UPI002E300E25|nr:hypothetical protein [Geminicoccus sp.]HEX2526924.1 hypothetical protein [Geminicoccus sp.]